MTFKNHLDSWWTFRNVSPFHLLPNGRWPAASMLSYHVSVNYVDFVAFCVYSGLANHRKETLKRPQACIMEPFISLYASEMGTHRFRQRIGFNWLLAINTVMLHSLKTWCRPLNRPNAWQECSNGPISEFGWEGFRNFDLCWYYWYVDGNGSVLSKSKSASERTETV
jgi:hypothetical protein